MRKLKMMACCILMLSQVINSQSLSLDKVMKVTLRNSAAIKQGTDVRGYYFFYVSDKIDKNTNEYTLRIVDENLQLLKDIKFQDSKKVSILESSFNGTDLIFLLYNDNERTFDYQVYGVDGNKKFNYTRVLTKKEERYLAASYGSADDEQTYKGLYAIEGQGFISNMPSREDKDYTFQIDYFSSEKQKQWTYTPTMGGKKFIADYLGTYNGVVFLEVLKFTSLMDKKPESNIIGLSLENGKQVFERTTDSKYRFYPASMSPLSSGKAYIYGEYFNPNDNIGKDKSLGFAFWEIDEKGVVKSEKYNAWDLELGKFLNVSSKGKIEDFGLMYLHNIFQMADGSIFAVGEGYKKVASALGILSTVASGGRSNVSSIKVKVTDLLLIRFDKDFNVKAATIYPKNSNTQELPSGMEFVSAPLLGKLIKYTFGEFDYSYTQYNKDSTSFSIYYADYERGKDYKGGTFNSISYTDGKITTDQVKTKSGATRSSVLASRQGQVLLLDYFKKEKRLDAHIEKMN